MDYLHIYQTLLGEMIYGVKDRWNQLCDKFGGCLDKYHPTKKRGGDALQYIKNRLPSQNMLTSFAATGNPQTTRFKAFHWFSNLSLLFILADFLVQFFLKMELVGAIASIVAVVEIMIFD